MKMKIAICSVCLFAFLNYGYGFSLLDGSSFYCVGLAQIPGDNQSTIEGSNTAKKAWPDIPSPETNVLDQQKDGRENLSGLASIDTIVSVNSKFAYVTIALVAVVCVLMLLLLVRMSGIRSSIGKIERDIMHTKEALRYIMELSQKSVLAGEGNKREGTRENRSERLQDATLIRIVAELEALSRKVDAFPRPATSGGKQLFSEEEVSREVQRRLEAMKIEVIAPGPDDVFDAALHEAVDVKPCRVEQDGTVFRVIQNGLAYNNRIVLKARVVVNRV